MYSVGFYSNTVEKGISSNIKKYRMVIFGTTNENTVEACIWLLQRLPCTQIGYRNKFDLVVIVKKTIQLIMASFTKANLKLT